VPIIGGAQQPQSPFIDIKPEENGPMFRLPVVALGFIPPDQVALLAEAIAGVILKAAAQGPAPVSENTDE
jgi:hypothetical protein